MLVRIIITFVVSLFITAQVYARSGDIDIQEGDRAYWLSLEIKKPNLALQCPVDQNPTDFITKKKDKTNNWITKKTSKNEFNNTWCFQKPDKSSSYPPGSIKKFNGIGYNFWDWN